MPSAANREGNVSEFHIVWRVVTYVWVALVAAWALSVPARELRALPQTL